MTFRFSTVFFLFLLAVLSVAALTAARSEAEPSMELWAGHQVVFGSTEVPILGAKETRSDSYVLASVRRDDKGMDIEQLACKVSFNEVMGVKVSIPEKALLRLPKAKFRFDRDGELFRAKAWRVGWKDEDVDKDGKPGLTIAVDASICSGNLNVASLTRSAAVGQLTEDGMLGRIDVTVKQNILGSDSRCLGFFSQDSEETQKGAFVYRRVPQGTTCESLLKKPWPVRAEVKNDK